MKLSELTDRLNLQILAGNSGLDADITGGYVSDLLSDVLGHAREGEVWITLQTHKNVIAVASLRKIPAVIFVKDLIPDEDTVRAAEAEGITLLGSSQGTYETAGKLFCLLNKMQCPCKGATIPEY